jgi:hypothetical protein
VKTHEALENEIVGEALVALQHEDLKEMGIPSVGHRLTILKSVYDIKIKQDIPIDSDHYVPLCKHCTDLELKGPCGANVAKQLPMQRHSMPLLQ